MGKIAKISVIQKDISRSAIDTQESSLRKQGYSRFPGTKRMLFPFKELDGKYRTGLDEDAAYLDNIPDPDIRKQEKERIKKERERLQKALDIDLSPYADFYKTHVTPKEGELKASGVQLTDGDNLFRLDIPLEAVSYAWLRVHPAIASSMAAYNRGDCPADTQFYVNDETYESTMTYNKKKSINEAVAKLNVMSLERRKKVGRLLDLPITEDTIEETVYNTIDTFLKEEEILFGAYKGSDPVRIFNSYVDLEDDVLDVRDLVEQAFKNQLYRIKKGKVYEGELKVFEDKNELIDHLLDPENQNDRLALDKKLRVKKLASV